MTRFLGPNSPVRLAVAGAVAAGSAWFALAMATGLIFHLMPAAPPLLAGIILRRGHQRSTTASAMVIGSAVVISLAVAMALARLGLPLDDAHWTIVVLVVGAAVGWALPHLAAERDRGG